MRKLSWVGLAVAIGLAAGCGGTDRVEVTGTVTLDGQPLKAGAISFISQGQGGTNAGGAIVDGKYTVPAEFGPTPGTYRVEIRWPKPTGKKFKSESGETLDVTEEGLPDKYHSKSELSAQLKSGKNTVDFELKSR